MPRAVGCQGLRNNIGKETHFLYWRAALFHSFLDNVISELDEKFVIPRGFFSGSCLIRPKLGDMDPDCVADINLAHQTDLDDEFDMEL